MVSPYHQSATYFTLTIAQGLSLSYIVYLLSGNIIALALGGLFAIVSFIVWIGYVIYLMYF